MIQMVLYCNECGNEIIPSDRYCKSCGGKLTEGSTKKIKCPECGNLIRENSDFCGSCGFKLNKDLRYIIRESNTKSCPKCSNKNNIDAEFCGNCGETLPIVYNLELINCPECNKLVRDDVNFCRFCGHDFITNKIPLFKKKYRPTYAYCQNCGKKIIDLNKTHYCGDCGTVIPRNTNLSFKIELNHEEFQILFVNSFIVPLSKHYGENFRKTRLKDYFKLTKEEELRIIYVIMEQLKKDNSIDVVKLFQKTFKETRENFENLEEFLLNAVKQRLTEMFNSNGISASDVTTVKSSSYDTINTPVVQNKHGGLTKGAATLGFGLVGLAATSGVKTTTETKKIFRSGEYTHFQITFNNRGIVLNSYNDDSPSNSFNSKQGNLNQIGIRYEDVHSFDINNFTLFLESGENFSCPSFDLKYVVRGRIKKFTTTYDEEVNNQFINDYADKIYDNVNSIVFELINEQIILAKDTKNNNQQQSNVDINGLEKIVSMYEKGLLSDEEFVKMKQNIIGNSKDNLDGSEEVSVKFCGNCGAEIVGNSNFCINCGNSVKY